MYRANQYLPKAEPIGDLNADLADGIKLAQLLNAISEDKSECAGIAA